MSPQSLVAEEQRVLPRYAVLASVAGVLIMVAAVLGLVGQHPKVAELTLELIVAHRRFPLDIISSVINGVGLLAFAAVVAFLAAATRARRPETQPIARIAALSGGVLAAVAGVVYAIVIAVKVDQFAATPPRSYEQAHAITSSTGVVVLPFLGQFSALLLAFGIFFTALNAMRAGLISRFMGYVGIFVGVLVIFPIGSPVPVVQGFWLLALGVLFAGRWPNGTPPAWEAGEARPWPSTTAPRDETPPARGGRGAGRAGRRDGGAEPEVEPALAAPRTTRAETPKRKRKKRR